MAFEFDNPSRDLRAVNKDLAREVEERRHVEAALRRSEADYRALFDHAGVGMTEASADGMLVRVNRKYCELTGYDAIELVGRSFMDITHPDDHGVTAVEYERFIRGESAEYRVEKRYIRKDGVVIWVQVTSTVRKDQSGQPLRCVAVVEDITIRKRAEQALRDSERRAREQLVEIEALYRALPIGLAVIGRDMRFRRINRNLARICGATTESLIERSMEESPTPLARSMERLARQVFESGEPQSQVELSPPDDDRAEGDRHWLAECFPIRDPDGSMNSVGLAVQEITERKRSEERLRLLAAELDHRVKNTLANIQSLVRQTRKSTTLESFSGSIEGRILTMARAHELLTRSQWRGVGLHVLVRDELRPYQVSGAGNVRIDGPDVTLEPSAGLALGMAVHELATNAGKYGALSATGGKVDIAWWIAQGPQGEWLELHWTERDGPPVRPPKRRGFGSVLIERRLGYELGGTVRLEFPPQGVTCRIEIPASRIVGRDETEPPTVVAPPERPVTDPGPRRILVVEDSALIAMEVQATLADMGWTAVGPAARVADALALVETQELDGAVLDVNVAGETVYAVADALAARGIPYLFASGYDAAGILPERFQGAPALSKPFTAEGLVLSLRRTFGP